MTKVKIFYLIMPWQIDYALLSYTQLKKSKYHISDDIEIEIDTHLNLSNYLIDWDKSQLPKEHFISKYNDLANLLVDYKHNNIIYEGDDNYGLLDMQKLAIQEDVDYYISICPDMYFSEYALSYLIESAKVIPNKYFTVTPQIHKMWDHTWDEITDPDWMDVPYDKWDNSDIFDIRYKTKSSDKEVSLYPTERSKWAIWFDLYSKEFYENLCPVHDDWVGYGPWDWYSMMLSEFAQKQGVDFQQYLLKGQTIFEYQIGPLKDRDFTKYYKEFLHIKVGAKEQRDKFEARMGEYLNKGAQMLKSKNII